MPGSLPLSVPKVYAKALVPSLAFGVRLKPVVDEGALVAIRREREKYWEELPPLEQLEARDYMSRQVRSEDLDAANLSGTDIYDERIIEEDNPVTDEARNLRAKTELEPKSKVFQGNLNC